MNYTHLTCCFLVVSAIALGGLLALRLTDQNPAEATTTTMAVSGDGAFEYITAKTESNPDVTSLFVLHKDTHMLVVYKPRVRGGRYELNPVAHYDLRRLMGTGQRGGAGPGGHSPR